MLRAMTRVHIAVLLSALALAGCKSPEEKLIDRRHELRERLDALYATYAEEGTPKAERRDADAGVVGRLLAGVDRAHFDEYCLAVGRGERPFALSGKLESFMKDSSHARACRRAAEIQVEIGELERESGARR